MISYSLKNIPNLNKIDFVCNINAASPLISDFYIKKDWKLLKITNMIMCLVLKNLSLQYNAHFSQ